MGARIHVDCTRPPEQPGRHAELTDGQADIAVHRQRRAADVGAINVVEAIAVDLADLPAEALDEAQDRALFARFGIPPARERIVRTAADAEQAARDFDDRVVLERLSNRITHKSNVGGVAVGLSAGGIGGRLTRMRCDVEIAAGFAPDVEALAAALVAFSRMALQLGERLVEAEINPLFVLDAGQGVRAADGVALLA